MPLNRFAPFNLSLRSKAVSTPDHLQPGRRTYLGESNARRLLKRSQLSKKASRDADFNDEPTLALHDGSALEAAVALPLASPPPTGYSVGCYATHAEDALRRKGAERDAKEKLVLFRSINASRRAEGTPALHLRSLLSTYAQDYADMAFREDHRLSHRGHEQLAHGTTTTTTTTTTTAARRNSVMVVMAPSGAKKARLVSPPSMGALACGEMWYSGKYRRHLFDMQTANSHPDDCPCHLRIVFETMVDEGWIAMGIGRGQDGRWVVELSQ